MPIITMTVDVGFKTTSSEVEENNNIDQNINLYEPIALIIELPIALINDAPALKEIVKIASNEIPPSIIFLIYAGLAILIIITAINGEFAHKETINIFLFLSKISNHKPNLNRLETVFSS